MISSQSSTAYTFEEVPCYLCGEESNTPFIEGQDDLGGKPGLFTFVRCSTCGLSYQQPRITFDEIGAFYDDEYIAHRKKKDWGILTKFYESVMGKHDRDKWLIAKDAVFLDSSSRVLDVGCGAGTFLEKVVKESGAKCFGIDFKDLSRSRAFAEVTFLQGTLMQLQLEEGSFDLITMWHFLEHDYTPRKTLEKLRGLLKPGGKLIIEVPRLDSLSFHVFKERWPGLQAPQHTVLFEKKTFLSMLEAEKLTVERYLPFGAFPAYFYFFAGGVFKKRKGAGVDFGKAIYPYFVGQILTTPLFFFEKKLNMAMQTAVCSRAELY